MPKSGKSSSGSEIPTILLLGQTGAGKSHFINVADPHLSIKAVTSEGIISCTQQVDIFEVKNLNVPPMAVRLVDTPGFNDTHSKNDDEHLKMIIQWLKKEQNGRIVGILYLHEIHCKLEESPTVVKPRDIPHPPGVFVVTTKWPLLSVSEEGAKTRETELRKRIGVPESFMLRFDNTTGSAWEIIHTVLSSPSLMKRRDLAKVMKKICVDRPNIWQDAIEMMSDFFANLFQSG